MTFMLDWEYHGGHAWLVHVREKYPGDQVWCVSIIKKCPGYFAWFVSIREKYPAGHARLTTIVTPVMVKYRYTASY